MTTEQPKPCPTCGHCPACGRSTREYVPYIPPYQPPANPYPGWPWQPVTITYTDNTSAIASGVVNTCAGAAPVSTGVWFNATI